MALLRLGNTRTSQNDDGQPRIEVKKNNLKMSVAAVLALGAVNGESNIDVAVDSDTGEAYVALIPAAEEGKPQKGRKLSDTGYLNGQAIHSQLEDKAESFIIDMKDNQESFGHTWYKLIPEVPETEEASDKSSKKGKTAAVTA